MSFVGKYSVDGKVLFLPITGNGFANLTFGKIFPFIKPVWPNSQWETLIFFSSAENVNIHAKVFPKVETREGEEFVLIERVKIKFTTSK